MERVLVRNAERMIVSALQQKDGIEVIFADGCKGIIPGAEVPELRSLSSMDLPNPYEIVLTDKSGEQTELPWDFVRHFCDASYKASVETLAMAGRQTLGERICQYRKAAGLTQEALALAAGVGRATIIRLEKGERIPRYSTLTAIAAAMERDVQDLLVGTDG